MALSARSSATIRSSAYIVLSLLVFGVASLLTGCTMSTTASPGSSTGMDLAGIVHGGTAPVVGAHVHLMAASTGGYGGAATSLLTSGTAGSDTIGGYVLTSSTGSFSITGDYTCVAGTQVYVLATQGNPGLSGSQTNPNLALMSAIGQCPAAGNFVATVPFIWINEVTTAASVYALAGYMTDLTHVGSSNTTLGVKGIANAFATVNNLVGVSTGAALATTPMGNGTPPQSELNTLANIIASCVNSVGASSATCTTLFSNAVNGSTHPTDTVTAAVNIAHNPAVNVGTLFGLQTGVASPYTPDLSAAPNDFTVAITFTGGGMNAPGSIAIDGNDHIWMVNYGAYTLSVINGVTGAAISPAGGYTGGGLQAPFAIAIDPLNNAWVVNPSIGGSSVTSVSKFTNAGAPASGSPFTGGGLTIGDNFNTLSPRDIAFDASGNAWIANNTASVTELNGTTGAAISPAAGFPLGSTDPNPNGVAVDGAGHVWISGFNGNVISEVSVSTGAVLFTSAYLANGLEQPYSVAIDSSNNVWLPNQFDPNSLVGFTVSKFNSSGGTVGVYSGGGILGPDGIAIDGAGNVWISNEIHNSITEMGNNGTAISPSTGYLSSGLFEAADIAVDGSGNVWAPNATVPVTFANGVSIVEFVGAAAPTVTPISVAVATGKLGALP
jgi:hypothetical protein